MSTNLNLSRSLNNIVAGLNTSGQRAHWSRPEGMRAVKPKREGERQFVSSVIAPTRLLAWRSVD